MGLADARVAERDDVLAALDVFTARQLQDHHLVERWDGLEVEAVEAFDGGELGLPDPLFDHPAFALDQFQFDEADEITDMVKRIERLWRRQGLKVPMKQAKKGRL